MFFLTDTCVEINLCFYNIQKNYLIWQFNIVEL